MATPKHKNPCPRGHEVHTFGRPFLGHYYYILSLSDLCLGVKTKILKEIMHFHYMTNMATPQNKNPCPRGQEMFNVCRPLLGYHFFILGLSDQCPGVEKKIKKLYQFYIFYLEIISPWVGADVMKLTIAYLHAQQMLHTQL